MNGGRTNIVDKRIKSVKKTITIKRDRALGSFNFTFTKLQRLHIMLEITSEHIIRSKKSLRLQKSKKQIIHINNLKKMELFKFFNT